MKTFNVDVRIVYDIEARDSEQAKSRVIECLKRDIEECKLDDFADVKVSKCV